MRSSPSGRWVTRSTARRPPRPGRRPSAPRPSPGRGARSARRAAGRARRRGGAREHEPLALAAGEHRPLLPDERVQAGRERGDPLAEPRALERGPELGVSRRPAARDAGSHGWSSRTGARPDRRGRRCAHVLLAVLAQVVPADGDPALSGSRKRSRRFEHGCLAGAARADQGDAPTRLEAQVEAAQDGLLGAVARGDALEGDGRPADGRGRGSAGSRTSGSRSTVSRTRRPAASAPESSRAAPGSGTTARMTRARAGRASPRGRGRARPPHGRPRPPRAPRPRSARRRGS